LGSEGARGKSGRRRRASDVVPLSPETQADPAAPEPGRRAAPAAKILDPLSGGDIKKSCRGRTQKDEHSEKIEKRNQGPRELVFRDIPLPFRQAEE